jgi:hypothetical protein
MPEDIERQLFEIAKGQDQIMHSLSAEMSVKTSLYLVFTAFIFSASLQVINFSKDLRSPCSETAIELCSVGAGFSLLAGTMLLVAAMVREYKIFPTREMVDWVRGTEKYREEYPAAAVEEPSKGVLLELIDTAEVNQMESEKKARWITAGAFVLFAALASLAIGGGFALYAFFSRPS